MKNMLYVIALAAGTFVLASCGGKDKDKDEPADGDIEDISLNTTGMQLEFASYITTGDSARHFGKGISADGSINVKNLAGEMKTSETYTGKVTGTVTSVCQNKGCWMKLDIGNGQTMMVTFKDYGFFVPKDLTGSTVVIEGAAAIETVSVADQQHYAKDAGKSEAEIKAITEPKQELSFVADGVLIQ